MPFITRCPHDSCRKFNLVDNEHQGKKVRCLVCNRTLVAHPAAPEEIAPAPARPAARPATPRPAAAAPSKPAPAAPRSPAKPAAADGFVLRQCPDCGSQLRIPQAAAGRKVKCQKCGTVFQ